MRTKNMKIWISSPSYIIRKSLTILSKSVFQGAIVMENDEKIVAKDAIVRFNPDILILDFAVYPVYNAGHGRNYHVFLPAETLVCGVSRMEYNVLNNDFFDVTLSINDTFNALSQKLESLLNKNNVEEKAQTDDLSDREKEVLVGIVKGKTNKEIADDLNLSVHTIISHRKNITRKLDIKSSSGLTIYAIMNNLIAIGDVKL